MADPYGGGGGMTFGEKKIPYTGGDFNENMYKVVNDLESGFGFPGQQPQVLVLLTEEEKAAKAAKRKALNNYYKAKAAEYDEQQRKLREELDTELHEEREKRIANAAAWASGEKSRANENLKVWQKRANAAAARKGPLKFEDPLEFVYGKAGRRTRRSTRTRRRTRRNKRTRK